MTASRGTVLRGNGTIRQDPLSLNDLASPPRDSLVRRQRVILHLGDIQHAGRKPGFRRLPTSPTAPCRGSPVVSARMVGEGLRKRCGGAGQGSRRVRVG